MHKKEPQNYNKMFSKIKIEHKYLKLRPKSSSGPIKTSNSNLQ